MAQSRSRPGNVSDQVGTPPLRVETDLAVSLDGTPIDVRSTGDRLFVEFPTLVSAVRGLRGLPARDRTRLHEALTRADVGLEVRVRHRTLAALGADARPGILMRTLGVGPIELRLGSLLSAVRAEFSAFVEHVRQFGR